MAEEKWYNKPIKGIPKSEEICVSHYNEGGNELLFITTRDYKGLYKLYKIENKTATFTKKKSKNPLDFDDYINKEIKKYDKKNRSDLL